MSKIGKISINIPEKVKVALAGNIVNIEQETRWSMNCRFKSIFSPYGDKKIGEFFTPITTMFFSRSLLIRFLPNMSNIS